MKIYPSIRSFKGMGAHLFAILIFGLFGYIIINIKYDANIYVYLIIFVGFFLFTQGPPTIYLLYTYYKIDKGKVYEINPFLIKIIEKKAETIYLNSDIEKIIIYMSKGNPKKTFALSLMDFLYYAHIRLKNDDELVITSLCAEDVDDILKQLEGVPIEYKWGFSALWKIKKTNNE
jgi:hypothetical protein